MEQIQEGLNVVLFWAVKTCIIYTYIMNELWYSVKAGSHLSVSPWSSAEIQLSLLELKVAAASKSTYTSIRHCVDSAYLALEPLCQPDRLRERGQNRKVFLQCHHFVPEWCTRSAFFSLLSCRAWVHVCASLCSPSLLIWLSDLLTCFKQTCWGTKARGAKFCRHCGNA